MYGIASKRGVATMVRIFRPVPEKRPVGRPPKLGTLAWVRRNQYAHTLPEPSSAAPVPSSLVPGAFSCPKCGASLQADQLLEGEVCPVCRLVLTAAVRVVGGGSVAPLYNQGATSAILALFALGGPQCYESQSETNGRL